MKPLVKYRGGKSKELQHIIRHIPHYEGRYIEPFFGGGAMFFHLQPERAIINDINAKLMSFYVGVKDHFNTLTSELLEIEKNYKKHRKAFDDLKKHNPSSRVPDENEALYYELRNMFNGTIDKKYLDATLYFFINKTAYSGMIRYNAKGEFNVPYGRYPNLNTSLITREHHDLLNSTDIYNLDYRDIFEMAVEEDFMFLDPPYDCTFSDYGNQEHKDGFDEASHRELANQFYNLQCKALMVIGRTPLTEELYGDMIIDEYGKSYAVNIRNRFKSAASHIVVSNFNENEDEIHGNLNFEEEIIA